MAAILGVVVDLGSGSLQLLPTLYSFRDALAHGKTRSVRRLDQPMPDDSGDSGVGFQNLGTPGA
jgi:hypothetical protein